jgi:hypothetical protein
MGFDRKMDSKVDSKPAWEASPPPFSFTVHFTVHPTTDSTYHTGRPPGRTRSSRLGGGVGVDQEKLFSRMFMPSTFARARSFPRTASPISSARPSVPPAHQFRPRDHGTNWRLFPIRCVGAKNMDLCGWVDPGKSRASGSVSPGRIRNQQVAGSIPAGGSIPRL